MKLIKDFSNIPELSILIRCNWKGEPALLRDKLMYYVLEFDKNKQPYAVSTHNYKEVNSLPDNHPMKYYNPILGASFLVAMDCALAENITLEQLISKN